MSFERFLAASQCHRKYCDFSGARATNNYIVENNPRENELSTRHELYPYAKSTNAEFIIFSTNVDEFFVPAS